MFQNSTYFLMNLFHIDIHQQDDNNFIHIFTFIFTFILLITQNWYSVEWQDD